MQFCALIVVIISTRAVFLRKWNHILKFSTRTEQEKLMVAVNSEIKVQIWLVKIFCVRKCKKVQIKNFIIVAFKNTLGINPGLTFGKEYNFAIDNLYNSSFL